MKYLIGDRKIFAIEFEVTKVSPLMGKICLWINGQQLGYFNEETTLYTVLSTLKFLHRKKGKLGSEVFVNKSKEEIFYLMNQSNEELEKQAINFDKHIVSLPESFDDFIVQAYEKNDTLIFIWKINEEPIHKYENYDTEVRSANISYEEFEKVLYEFENFIMKLINSL